MNLPIYQVESPFDGIIEKVYVTDQSYLYEWERLFLLKTSEGVLEEIKIGVSGTITSLTVSEGQQVRKHVLLASLQDDYTITGSD